MGADQDQLLAELPLPLAPDADVLDAIAIAIAIEEACGVTLPDWALDVAHLGRRETVRATLQAVAGVS